MASTIDKRVLLNNQQYVDKFRGDGLDIHPASKVVIVTCMDCRIDPISFCGFKLGEATIIRNAGAYAGEAARSALLTTHILGAEDIYIIKHTKCGLLGVDANVARHAIKQNLGITESKDVDAFEVFPITDLDKSAAEDVEFFRNHPLMMPKIRVTGWVYDTDSGTLKQIVS
ncbi:carbonic anhydrase domain-containing protein [Penicillium cinerascens]|uniref:Carbonic anhydrase n=1 Tax=Penicillium cinerascens TaxID=70096 RepID=A0A9W9TDK1_9EURO|nr:carbonic anhydrase domain-containing protein [Penicillium cinerascens]KAJ5218838.1 carbonic anhydrase domain-containing protein [Penicillium cinerascens]